MAIRIYVGNLPYAVNDDKLRQLFEGFGEVASATVLVDRDTRRSKGFGFVEMSDDAAAMAAIEGMNGKEVEGRTLTVNEARPKEDRPPRRDFNRGPRRDYDRGEM